VSQLPELEVLRRDLERDVSGKRIKDVTVRGDALLFKPGDEREFAELLAGQRIGTVARLGVHLVFELDDERALVARLGRQGSLSRETAAAEGGRNTRLIATFTTGGALHYTDPGDDGEFSVVMASELASMPELGKLGIDPLAHTFTWRAFGQELVRRDVPLKTVMLDSSFVVGLGDLYSDEVLWAAGLSGRRQSSTLSSQEVRRLYRSLLEVLHEAVKQRTSDGLPAPQSEDDDDEDVSEGWLKVWGREGLPCARCRQPIRHGEVVDGAPSYHCGNCQT
jgi:formamidopyrimidine-DNA glycosylase